MSGSRPDRMIRAFLDHLVVERGTARNTVDSYARDLRRYRAHLDAAGHTDLAAVDSADVTAFVVALREGDDDHPPLAPSSTGRALVAVRGLHRFAVREGYVERD
ncbi:MAG: site-specific integrase, partial [Thermocrispum sp.]